MQRSPKRLRWLLIPLSILAAFALVFGVSKAAHAATYNTMRPVGNTNYCVADPNGGLTGYAQLNNGCKLGTAQAWATPSSAWGNGTYNIVNEHTGLCLETDGGGVILYMAHCNGDEAQSWFYEGGLGVNHNETTWISPYTSGGTNYCADANSMYGVRAELCNGTGAQVWYGPQSF